MSCQHAFLFLRCSDYTTYKSRLCEYVVSTVCGYRKEDAEEGDLEKFGVKGFKKQLLVEIWWTQMSLIETNGGWMRDAAEFMMCMRPAR